MDSPTEELDLVLDVNIGAKVAVEVTVKINILNAGDPQRWRHRRLSRL